MSARKLTLVWHEAGNELYHDRFRSLSQHFSLRAVGPVRFRGKVFADIDHVNFQIKLYNSAFNRHWLSYLSLGLIASIVKDRSDILYVHEEPHSVTAFLCALIKRKKVLVLETSLINYKGNFRGLNLFERFVYHRCDAIFPKNAEVAEILKKRGANPALIRSPMGNGVARASFEPVPRDQARAKLRRDFPQFNPPPEQTLLGFAGRIWHPKGLRLLVDAANAAGMHLVICGPVIDHDLLEYLQKEGATILPELNKKQLPCFYSSLDLFALPSLPTPGWREQFGRVCAEAIYCGTPAIGSDIGGIPGVVMDRATFSAGSMTALTEKLKSLATSSARDELHHDQLTHIEQNFTWDALAQRVALELRAAP